MTWQRLIQSNSPVWTGVIGYADARIAALTAICISPDSKDKEIRDAQAGILEMNLLKGVPDQLQNTAEQSRAKPRREY